MNKDELLNYNIMCGVEALLNCYYDEAITEPKPLSEWVDYVYKTITTDFFTPDYIEMGNQTCKLFGKKVIEEKTIEYLKNYKCVQKYIKKED